MRIAICFFGEIRGNPVIWQRVLDCIVKPHHADVFMHHVYYNDDMLETLDASSEKEFILKEYYPKKGVNFKPPAVLFEMFKPVKALFEKRPSYDYTKFYEIKAKKNNPCNPFHYHAIKNQAESRKKSLQLKTDYENEHHFKYDIVINTRLDLKVTGVLQMLLSPNLKTSYCGGRHHIFEQLIYGPSDAMNTIGGFYDEIDDVYMEQADERHGIMMNEFHLGNFLSKKNILVENVPLPLDYSQHQNGLQRSPVDFYKD